MLKIHINQNINFQLKRESPDLKHFNNSKAFIEHSNDSDDIYKKSEEYNRNRKRKILIVLDDIIADMFSNKKLNPIITELSKSISPRYLQKV